MYKPDPDGKPDRYAVIYVDHSGDLTGERFPFRHPRAACWVRRAGSRWKVYICTYEVPGGGRAHREQITRELTAIYRPRCNGRQYGQAWKEEWIGQYSAPTTAPVTRRDPRCTSAPVITGTGRSRMAMAGQRYSRHRGGNSVVRSPVKLLACLGGASYAQLSRSSSRGCAG